LKPPAFDYEAPTSLAEALAILQRHGDEAKVLAGGQSLMPMLNMRLARPAVIVDINRIPDLAYVREADGHLAVGALARHVDLLRSPSVAAGWPLLREATAQIGHPAIRNRGTVAGSIAHSDPSAEHPAVLACLDGEVVVAGPAGRRIVKPDAFFVTYLTTDLRPDEVVVEVRFPRLPPRTGSAFVEFAQRSGDFAIVGVAAAVTVDEDGVTCREARIALTGVGGTPFRAREAEAMLRGRRLVPAADDAFREAAAQVAASIEPDDDIHASARYRRHLAQVLTERALARASERALQGGRQ
jgi:carbon-monoxide dehydrogenase medium subunit